MGELSDNERSRYQRHIILGEIGEKGQEKIRKSKVFVAGAGGLGCPVIQYLTATGVGKIGIMDDDKIDASNLQRQVLYGTNDLGRHKSVVAAQLMREMNSNVDFEIFNARIDYGNALAIVGSYDILVDCTDNFKARYVLNDAAVLSGKPLVHASVFKYQGQLSVFNYKQGPSYRCLFPLPDETMSDNTDILGIYSIIPGILGLLQANEVIKIITGSGEVLSGKLLLYNAFTNQTSFIKITRNNSNFDRDELIKSFSK